MSYSNSPNHSPPISRAARNRNHRGQQLSQSSTVARPQQLLSLTPRTYQQEVFEEAKRRNIIAFLDTGAGKTLISILLINEVCANPMAQNRVIFLVNQINLVTQQSQAISASALPHIQIGRYFGGSTTHFDDMKWRQEIAKHHVLVFYFVFENPPFCYFSVSVYVYTYGSVCMSLSSLTDSFINMSDGILCQVMTTQICLGLLDKNLLNFSDISLLILDECHHATGSHPM